MKCFCMYSVDIKGKIILMLVKDGQGDKHNGREIELNSTYNKDTWRFIAKLLSGVWWGWSVDGKLRRF